MELTTKNCTTLTEEVVLEKPFGYGKRVIPFHNSWHAPKEIPKIFSKKAPKNFPKNWTSSEKNN